MADLAFAVMLSHSRSCRAKSRPRIGTCRNGPSAALEKNGFRQREESGAPGAIRTPGPQIRSLMLYPAELRVHWSAAIRRGLQRAQPLF